MRKFKHKITGDIAITKVNNSSFYIYDGLDIHARIVENSNDWEEIIEKDYEILEFTYNKWLTFKLNSNGYYFDVAKDAMCFGVRMTDFKEVCINKIRRLSDGEVFSLGDKVQTNNKSFKGIIEEFKTYNNTILAFLETPDLEKNKVWVALELLQHYKEPLFTTEDGKDIFEGDIYYVVMLPNYNIRSSKEIEFILTPDLKRRTFSTKENAEKYVHENKPVFSRKQIRNAVSISDIYFHPNGRSYVKWESLKHNLKI